MLWQWGLLATVSIVALYTDARHRKIPNRLTAAAVIAGFALHTASGGFDGAAFAGLGAISGLLLLLVPYGLGAIGAGDVKLFAGLGAILGTAGMLVVLSYALLFAGLIGAAIWFRSRDLANKLQLVGYALLGMATRRDFSIFTAPARRKMTTFPFMFAVAPGLIAAAWDMTGT